MKKVALIMGIIGLVFIVPPITLVVILYVPADKAKMIAGDIMQISKNATDQQNPDACFNLPKGPLFWVNDTGNPWKPFWNPIVVHYPVRSCISKYKAVNYDSTSSAICDLYDEVRGFSSADQAWCYQYFAEIHNNPDDCTKTGVTDYYCLAQAQRSIEPCYQVEYSSELYASAEITTAACIADVSFTDVENRSLELCLLIDPSTGYNWQTERNSCLYYLGHQLKGTDQEYCHLYEYITVEEFHDASRLFEECDVPK